MCCSDNPNTINPASLKEAFQKKTRKSMDIFRAGAIKAPFYSFRGVFLSQQRFLDENSTTSQNLPSKSDHSTLKLVNLPWKLIIGCTTVSSSHSLPMQYHQSSVTFCTNQMLTQECSPAIHLFIYMQYINEKMRFWLLRIMQQLRLLSRCLFKPAPFLTSASLPRFLRVYFCLFVCWLSLQSISPQQASTLCTTQLNLVLPALVNCSTKPPPPHT